MTSATDAVAYIDPGYGALVQQIVLSGFFGALFLGRKLLLRLVGRVASLFSTTRTAGAAEEPSDVAAARGHQSLGRKG